MKRETFDNLEAAAEAARARDESDPVNRWRDAFHVPCDEHGRELAYLCGNSLGLQPKATRQALADDLDMWAERAVEGHLSGSHPWLTAHEFVREPLAALVGAKPAEVVAMNSLTVNLHLMMVSFYRPQGARRKILIEARAFPSDRYAVYSQIIHHGGDPERDLIEVAPANGGNTLDEAELIEQIERHRDELALVLLPGVQYLNGQLLDIATLSGACRQLGVPIGWDLAHAVGNVPMQIHDAGCDFAVWCHYKYCNSGPGAVGGCFVHERHARITDVTELPRLAGWWGHDADSRFRMGPEFRPSPGADGWQLSNPPILALTPVRVALSQFAEAGIDRLRDKSVQLTSFLEHLIERFVGDHVEILTPGDPARRGCQLSLRIRRTERPGREVFEELTRRGIIGDWREPDVIRVAPAPFYNRFADTLRLVAALDDIIRN